MTIGIKTSEGLNKISDYKTYITDFYNISKYSLQAGPQWYRIAETDTINNIGSMQINIARNYNNFVPEVHTFQINIAYDKFEIYSISSLTRGFAVQKIRLVKDQANHAYLEIYYNNTVGNHIRFKIIYENFVNAHWNLIQTLTKTEENVEGITVLTSYNIHPNFKNRSNFVDRIDASTMETYNNLHTQASDKEHYEYIVNNLTTSIETLGGGEYYLEGCRTDSQYGWQTAKSYVHPDNQTSGMRCFTRCIFNGVWNEWKQIS